MDVDSAARDGNKRVFNRLGAAPASDKPQKVCYHWRAGRCSRNPCPFLHRELAPPQSNDGIASKRPYGPANDRSFSGPSSMPRRPNPNMPWASNTWGRNHGGGAPGSARVPRKTQDKVCHYWLDGNCTYGDRCRFLHSWFLSDCFTLLTHLEGHQKVISGIALSSGSDKLYSGSKDQSVRVWDCQSGQCAGVINLGGEIGCMISEGPWLFVGIPNAVKAWHTQTASELSLNGPAGQVYALVVGNGMLFAGTQDGNILAWKFDAASNCFQPAASLQGHSLGVVALVIGANRLYSGSMDQTIRVWDLESLQCIQTLTGHTSVVMSVLCWDQFLLSCSLDKTIKVWVATENGDLEVTYTHSEEHVCCLWNFLLALLLYVFIYAIRVQVLNKSLLPTLEQSFASVHTEECRRSSMLHPPTEKSALQTSSTPTSDGSSRIGDTTKQGIVQEQQRHPVWGPYAQRLLDAEAGLWRNPTGGGHDDKAHPPIHPTKFSGGESGWSQDHHQRLYELVVRHFLACVSQPAIGAETTVEIDIAGESFSASGRVIIALHELGSYLTICWALNYYSAFFCDAYIIYSIIVGRTKTLVIVLDQGHVSSNFL
ncbi:zinc finger CCCH domain-containing protein 48-like [Macadamia integrifolia]|uniref:zinc finger CCCH domain-containing protein 48-like n=1 Tax=Macadamia integrifolia TaxID=60698 RepID=UPI001C52A0FF|nr:zinc finger CCCH domain-containing protein 48-like [Macadamia integrifolia]